VMLMLDLQLVGGGVSSADPPEVPGLRRSRQPSFRTKRPRASSGLSHRYERGSILITKTTYDPVGHKTQIIEGEDETASPKRTTSFIYDELDRLIGTGKDLPGAPSGRIDSHTFYFDEARCVRSYDWRQIPTWSYLDAAGRLIEKRECALESMEAVPSRVTRYLYDDASKQVTTIDQLGNPSVVRNDDLGREIERIGPSGELTSTTYNKLGKVASVSKALDGGSVSVETRSYDPLGRLSASVDPLGNPTTFSYDRAGNKTQATDPAGHTTRWAYDGYNKLVYESMTCDGAEQRTSYTYDPSGNKISQTDGAGRAVAYSYDSRNRLNSVVTDPDRTGYTGLKLSTSYAYDTKNALATVTDPRHKVTLRRTYDSLGRLAGETDALSRTWSYSYDNNGNLTGSTDPAGRTVSRSYNYANLISSLNPPGTSDDVSYTYDDAAGYRTLSSNSGERELSFTWDASRRLTALEGKVGSQDLEQRTELQSFSYDRRGKLVRSELSGVEPTTYAYDPAGDCTSVQAPGASYALAYYPDRALESSQTTFANMSEPSLSTDYSYFENEAVASITTTNAQGATLACFSYGYDAGGLPASRDAYLQGNPGSGLSTYTYDAAARLTSAVGPQSFSYSYDAAGNMLSKTSGGLSTAYTYDDANQLASSTSVRPGAPQLSTAYSYDPAGNLTSLSSQEKTASYTYNALNQLEGASIQLAGSPAQVVSYTYDPLGRAVLRSGGDAITRTAMFSTTDEPARITTETEGSPVERTGFDRQPDTRALLGSTDETGETLGLTTDMHTDVVLAADSQGEVSSSCLYSPYGEKTSSAGADLPLGFQGDRADPATGLVDMGARDYDPALGRFIECDPAAPEVSDAESFNEYLYADGAPLGRIDPLGQSWWNPVDWGRSIYRNAIQPVSSFINRSIIQPVYQNVVLPVGRAIENGANFVGRTMASAAGAAGRAVIKAARGAGQVLRTGLRAVGVATRWVGRGVKEVAGELAGGGLFGSIASIGLGLSGAWNWYKGLGERTWYQILNWLNPVVPVFSFAKLIIDWRTNSYIDSLIHDSEELWTKVPDNPRADKTQAEIRDDYMHGYKKQSGYQVGGMTEIKAGIAADIAEVIFTSAWSIFSYWGGKPLVKKLAN
jgi:RHS repeat-associated protein